LLNGARVKDVQGLPPRDVLLILEPAAGPPDGPPILRLRLSAHADSARIHLQQGRVQRHDGPMGPFFQGLEKELLGATLRRIEQVRGDRIVLLEFIDTPSDERRALLGELTGRHANMVLLGRNDVVQDVLVPPPAKAKHALRLALGSPWQPPGSGAQAPDQAGDDIAGSFLEPTDPPPGRDPERAPLSWRVENSLGEQAVELRDEELRKKLQSRTARKLGRAKSLVAGLEQRLSASNKAERVRQDGELLKACLGQISRGMESFEVADWFTDGAPLRSISLDPRRDPRENIEKLFARYKKLERAHASVEHELALAREKLAALEALTLAAADLEQDPAALDDEAVARGLLDKRQEADPRKKKAPDPRRPYRVFKTSAGSEVRVGRTAKDNDTLTTRHARGNDLWLHTAECPGSHVVLVVGKGSEPDPEEILDAAHLAVHFSPVRGTDRAPVHVAKKKFVHKPKGAKAGLVTLSGGRILKVRMQQGRLDALLRSARGPAEG
jgi:predicted ribosome quality control (RQC) complex YloA/Tae2 family protein